MIRNSFRRRSGSPPRDYRTPSPPIDYYEAVSPSLQIPTAHPLPTPPTPEHERLTPERINGGKNELTRDGSEGRRDNSSTTWKHTNLLHLGTSLGSQNSSTPFLDAQESTGQSTRKWEDTNPLGIDYLQESSWTRGSGQLSDKRRYEEAELLLNFTREARLAVPKNPITLQAQPNTRSQSFGAFTNIQRPLFESPRAHRSSESYADSTTRPYLEAIVTKSPNSQRNELRASNGETHTTTSIPTQDDSQLGNKKLSKSKEKQTGQPAKNGDVDHVNIRNSKKPNVASGEQSASQWNNETLNSNHLNTPTSPLQHKSGSNLDTGSVNQISEKSTHEKTMNVEVTRQDSSVKQEPGISNSTKPSSSKNNGDTGSAKLKKVNSPSVCALCKFSRNSFIGEQESESTSWISCDGCLSWFHFACAGFRSEREVRSVDKFRCKTCKPIHGPTTYVRKSTRAHTAIDYAGLNEGVIKTSDEDPEHHYVKDFKNGKKFTPENFARIRPELVTAEFFERGDGMKEPVLIPAAFNPRPRHIPRIDALDNAEGFAEKAIDNEELHDRAILDTWMAQDFEYETVQDQGQDALDMVIPHDLTVRKVSELYGPDEKLEVIDVKSQNGEDKPWTMKRWVDYYESSGEKIVRNVISLEVSQSKLGRLIRRPKVVRDLDLQDAVWPGELQAKGEYPKVQFYCLMSVADCYTDFHIDFGGSSVYYHILKGKKTFFFIPPTEKHLKQYEEWCNSPAQNWTFLGDQTKECYRVDLSEGDTMLIPAGWIHAVWTPEDSLVIGGNFLTRLHYPLQIKIAQIEKATNVARKFRYPHFQKVLWYTALRYLDEDPIPESVMDMLAAGQSFPRPEAQAGNYDRWGEKSLPGDENYHARYYSKPELDGLPELCRYLLRTALIAAGHLTDGISVETRNAVKRSIPKSQNHGEPLEVVKKFAMWCTWKRGNEPIPYWAYPEYMPESGAAEQTEKRMSAKARRKLDREAAYQAYKVAPDRQSTRPRNQPQNLLTEIMANQTLNQSSRKSGTPGPESNNNLKRKLEETPNGNSVEGDKVQTKKLRTSSTSKSGSGRKPACEACRKSRRACKHRDESSGNQQVIDTPDTVHTSITLNNTPTKANQVSLNGSHLFDDNSMSGLLQLDIIQPENPDTEYNPNGTTPGYSNGVTAINNKAQLKTHGRTKACKDCRKSKVRHF
jgi:F-box and leucine-rich repeat protein 10/11